MNKKLVDHAAADLFLRFPCMVCLMAILAGSPLLAADSMRSKLLQDQEITMFVPFDDSPDAEISEEGLVASTSGESVFEDGVVKRGMSLPPQEAGWIAFAAGRIFDHQRGTIMFWFQPGWNGDDEVGKYTLAWITMQNSDKYFAIHRSLNSNPKELFVNFSWDNSMNVRSPEIFQQGVWVLIAVTWSEEQQQYALYVNGEIAAEKAWKAIKDPDLYRPVSLKLGKYYPHDDAINSSYDELMLFKRALSSEEIRAYFNETNPNR